MRDLTLKFTDTAEEEIERLVTEMALVPLAHNLTNMDEVPKELKEQVSKVLGIVLEMFSSDTPMAYGDPEETLKVVSREINLGRLLKERGIFRFYRLLEKDVYFDIDTGKQIDPFDPDRVVGMEGVVAVPLSQTLTNPNTGQPFAHDNDFIGWFCEEAHVSRSLLFRRIMAIRRMVNTLGFTVEEAFNVLVSKPFVIEETIRMIADWNKDELDGISPEVALTIAKRVQPDQSLEWEMLAEQAGQGDPEAMQSLIENSKPVIAQLLREVAQHERSRDAMDTVRHDIVKIPEIRYRCDPDGDFLVVTIIVKSIDEENEEYTSDIIHVPFIPDTSHLPEEIKKDLIKRLPIQNRDLL